MSARTRKSRVKPVLTGVLIAICLPTVLVNFYIQFHYPVVMPHWPQPQTGRIYPIWFKEGGTVYVNKKELDARDLVEYRLLPLAVLAALLYFGIGTRLGWWDVGPRRSCTKF